MLLDYLCEYCHKPCGGDVGETAYLVDRINAGETERTWLVLCAVCWAELTDTAVFAELRMEKA